MRGGVNATDLFTDTDYEDLAVMQKIVRENIENTKNAKMPLI